MSGRGGGKKEIDPEELMRRKFRAKCLFRALGRLVLANVYWMIEGVDQYEGIEDVKRRVAQAVRQKSKKKQLLSFNDKALLNKPAHERTDHEKLYLYKILGGLKCFKRYPHHVKRKLAAVAYFKYYSPNRVIVRQHHEAHALYFIVSGDVVVSQMVFDELLQQYVSVDIGSMHQGDMFGEVSLLHNILRTATVTTVGHCELLALMKEDFKNVLQASIQMQWDEVRKAMSAFTYFDALDEVSLREGCIVAKMKSYEVNETILGDGVGVHNFVYFVLSGRCQMIESLEIITKTHLGRNHYTLYDPYVPEVESEQDFDQKYFGAYKNLIKEASPSHSEALLEVSQTKDTKKSEDIKTSAIRSSFRASTTQKTDKSVSLLEVPENTRKKSRISAHASDIFKQTHTVLHPPETTIETVNRESIRISIPQQLKERPKTKTYFMQVCQMNPGSTFGFGENMRDRRIVALTQVQCMLMPKIWLLQKNTANIWTRIQHYLDKKIPTKKDLFKEYVSARRWQEFKDQRVEDVVAGSKAVNYTTIHDVPYSIRMEEMLDI